MRYNDMSLYWLGKKHTNITKEKQRLAKLRNPTRYWLGKKRSLEDRIKMGLPKKGKTPWNKEIPMEESSKEKLRNSIKELWKNQEYKDKTIKARQESNKNKGKYHYNWQDGKSFEKYPQEFNKKLKEIIKLRDSFKCQECLTNKIRLDIHHIDYNKKNNQLNNLITLCISCHMKTNFRRQEWQKRYKDKLNKNSRRD